MHVQLYLKFCLPLVSGSMLALTAPARCCGTTKSGQRCSITSSSSMRDSLGRLVADPLRRGSPFCMLHTVLFRVEPAHVCDCIVVYMDLETSSLDILSGKIVEIGALIEGSHSTFSTVVDPGQDDSIEQPSVHGIPHEELLLGPCFAEAFQRFCEFVRYAALSTLAADDDSEDDQHVATAMRPDLDIMIVSHNGQQFDFPFLLSECMRAGISSAAMAEWVYVDTLDVLRATDSAGECKKLQCALRSCSGSPGLRAHRALDDCLALGSVVRHISASLGVTPWMLLMHFATRLDEVSTCLGLSALLV